MNSDTNTNSDQQKVKGSEDVLSTTERQRKSAAASEALRKKKSSPYWAKRRAEWKEAGKAYRERQEKVQSICKEPRKASNSAPCQRIWYQRNRETILAKKRQARLQNMEYERRKLEEGRKELKDWYIRKILSKGSSSKDIELFAELVEVKRLHIKLKRLLKEQTTQNTL